MSDRYCLNDEIKPLSTTHWNYRDSLVVVRRSVLKSLLAGILLVAIVLPAWPNSATVLELIDCPKSHRAKQAVDLAVVASRYKALLDRTQLSVHAKQVLVLDCLRSNLMDQRVGHMFWQRSVNQFLSNRVEENADWRQQLAIALHRLYGDQAKVAPAFLDVFQPLAFEAGYLSPADQRALSEHQQQHMLRRLALPMNSFFDPYEVEASGVIDVGAMPELSVEGLAEYELRNSHTAHGMLRSGVAWTEGRFRKVHQLLHNMQKRGGDLTPDQFQQSNAKLTDWLGADAALRVRAALDPRFDVYRAKAGQLGLTEAQTYQAFQIIANSEFEIWQSAVEHTDDQAAAYRAMQAAAALGEQMLMDYVGQTQAVELRQALIAAVPAGAYLQ